MYFVLCWLLPLFCEREIRLICGESAFLRGIFCGNTNDIYYVMYNILYDGRRNVDSMTCKLDDLNVDLCCRSVDCFHFYL